MESTRAVTSGSLVAFNGNKQALGADFSSLGLSSLAIGCTLSVVSLL